MSARPNGLDRAYYGRPGSPRHRHSAEPPAWPGYAQVAPADTPSEGGRLGVRLSKRTCIRWCRDRVDPSLLAVACLALTASTLASVVGYLALSGVLWP